MPRYCVPDPCALPPERLDRIRQHADPGDLDLDPFAVGERSDPRGRTGQKEVARLEGHAPRGVTARHYIPRLSAVTKGEESAFAQAMQVFKTLVVAQINQMASSNDARILNFFEPSAEGEKVLKRKSFI